MTMRLGICREAGFRATSAMVFYPVCLVQSEAAFQSSLGMLVHMNNG
jgi:hypothetical protein